MSHAIDQSQIVHDLRNNLDIRDGDLLAVHSSMKSLGQILGGPAALIQALIQAVGGPEQGTILMPCFTMPLDVVDVVHTPSRLGLVPETFRTFPGVHLSQNHTHRVAVLGKHAKAIADCHLNTTPLGVGSPFHELAKRGGSILHIGCDFRACSLIHVAEWIYPLPFNKAEIPYPDYNKTITLICQDGQKRSCPPKQNPGDSAGFLSLQSQMERYGLIRHGTVGPSPCLKARGLDILEMALELLSQNPTSLLCQNPSCPVCPPKRKIAINQ